METPTQRNFQLKKGTIAIVFIIGIVVISVLATLNPEIFSILSYIPGGDKIGHFFLFGIATLLVSSALPGSRSFLLGGSLVTLLVVLDEYIQLYFTTLYHMVEYQMSFYNIYSILHCNAGVF